jgi:hypothetical protein
MMHYIAAGGSLHMVIAGVGAGGFNARYLKLRSDADARKRRKAKAVSKIRYSCPSCTPHVRRL